MVQANPQILQVPFHFSYFFFYGDICCLKVKSATSVTAHAPGAWKAKPPAFKNDSRA
jgi:hypothetical protein